MDLLWPIVNKLIKSKYYIYSLTLINSLGRTRGVSPTYASAGVSTAMRATLSQSQEPQVRNTTYATYGSFSKADDRLNKSFSGAPTMHELVTR